MSKAERNGNQQLLDRAEIGAAAVGGACAGSAVGALALDIAWHATRGAVLQTLPAGCWLLAGSLTGALIGALIGRACLWRDRRVGSPRASVPGLEQRELSLNVEGRRMKSKLPTMAPVLLRWSGAALLLFAASLGACFVLLTLAYPRSRTLLRAPLFALRDTEGRLHQLEDYAGRPLVLVFLHGGASERTQGIRTLNDAVPEFDRHGLKVFAVVEGVDGESAAELRVPSQRFPVLRDANGAVASAYHLRPAESAAFVIGTRGVIMQATRSLQTARLGEQMLTLARCCLEANAQRKLRGMGKPVADARLPRVTDGSTETLYGDLVAPATVLLFLSAECPCSRGYDQRIRDLIRDYGPVGVRFVGISAGADETAARVAAHSREAGFAFPLLRDQGNHLADRLEAQVTPEVYVMDRERVLRYHGRIDDSRDADTVRSHDLRNALDALIAGKLPPVPEVGAFGCAISRQQHTVEGRPTSN